MVVSEMNVVLQNDTSVCKFTELPPTAAFCQHETQLGDLLIWHVRRKAASRCDLVLHIGSGCCCGAFSTLANETVTKFQLEVKMGTTPFSFRKGISVYSHKSVAHCLNCKRWKVLAYCFLMALSPPGQFSLSSLSKMSHFRPEISVTLMTLNWATCWLFCPCWEHCYKEIDNHCWPECYCQWFWWRLSAGFPWSGLLTPGWSAWPSDQTAEYKHKHFMSRKKQHMTHNIWYICLS